MNISGEEDTKYTQEREGFHLIQKDCSLDWATLRLRSREIFQLFNFSGPPPCLIVERMFLRISFLKHGCEKTK